MNWRKAAAQRLALLVTCIGSLVGCHAPPPRPLHFPLLRARAQAPGQGIGAGCTPLAAHARQGTSIRGTGAVGGHGGGCVVPVAQFPARTPQDADQLHADETPEALLRELGALHGSHELGYFYTYLWVGAPAQRVSVIVDTGSFLSAWPCAGCRSCGTRHLDAPFNTTASSSAELLRCSSQEASGRAGGEGSCPPGTLCREGRCTYSVRFGEGSSIAGSLWSDTVRLGEAADMPRGSAPAVRHTFGCHTEETAQFLDQAASGIMGLSRRASRTLLPSEAFASGAIPRPTYTLCAATQGGQLSMGLPVQCPVGSENCLSLDTLPNARGRLAVRLAAVSLLPASPSSQAHGIVDSPPSLAVDQAELASGKGVIVDSGNTFSFLHSGLWRQLTKQLQEAAVAACGAGALAHGTCTVVPPATVWAARSPLCLRVPRPRGAEGGLDASHHEPLPAAVAAALPAISLGLGRHGEHLVLPPSTYFYKLTRRGAERAGAGAPLGDATGVGGVWCVGVFDAGGSKPRTVLGGNLLANIALTVDTLTGEASLRAPAACGGAATNRTTGAPLIVRGTEASENRTQTGGGAAGPSHSPPLPHSHSGTPAAERGPASPAFVWLLAFMLCFLSCAALATAASAGVCHRQRGAMPASLDADVQELRRPEAGV